MENQSNGTTLPHISFNAQHTFTTQSKSTPSLHLICTNSFDRTPVADRTVNLGRITPITLSTCILTFANFLVVSISLALNCLRPFVNAGISNLAPIIATESPMFNPLSAITRSPGKSLFRYPECSVIYHQIPVIQNLQFPVE